MKVRTDFMKGDWALFNDDGDVIGLREDTPDELKRQYNRYKKTHDEYMKPIKGSYYMDIDGWLRPNCVDD